MSTGRPVGVPAIFPGPARAAGSARLRGRGAAAVVAFAASLLPEVGTRAYTGAPVAAPRVLNVHPAAGCKSAGGVLPAGLRFARFGNYEEVVREVFQCPRPSWAVIAGVAPTAQAAATSVARIIGMGARAQLAPGYPWAVHTSELGLAVVPAAGVALVIATFETTPEADNWLKAHAQLSGPLTLEAFARGGDGEGVLGSSPRERQTVVRVQAGTDVPALTMVDAKAQAAAAARAHRQGPAPGGAATPACWVHPGSMFLFRATELFPIGLPARAFSPVRCEDGAVAYLPWTSTVNESVIWQDKAGEAHLSQITAVECDAPVEILDWTYGSNGRRAPPRRLPVHPCQ